MFQDQGQMPNTPLKPISSIKTMPPAGQPASPNQGEPSQGRPTVPQPPKEPIKKSGKLSSAGWAIIIVFILALGGGGGYLVYANFFPFLKPAVNINANTNQTPEPPPIVKTLIEKINNLIGAPIAMATAFATYDEPAVNASPAVPTYQAAADLSNVENAGQFGSLTESAKGLLAKNNFAVVPGYTNEFFSLYESNRYSYTPNFITSDSILHNYHLAFDYLLRSMETDKLKAEATSLTYGMLKASQDQYQQLKSTAWENAAKRNVAFFAVANKLLYPSAQVADYVSREVAAELVLIENHTDNSAPSAVMNIGNAMPEDFLMEDYTQYIPRGHYTRSDDLKIYFKSMMYLGRLTFRLKSEDETKSAALIALALRTNENLKNSWEKIYEPTAFFVGVADDLTYVDYYKELSAVFGNDFTLTDLTSGETFKNFIISANNLPAPKINSMPIFDARLRPDRTKEIKGFRFMGQRYTLDADIFQRLIYREVGDKQHPCDSDPTTWKPGDSRRLPSAVDVAAAFGSTSAADIQDKKGETGYACYTENMNKMRSYVAGLDGKTWTQNLYWGWLYFLRPLLADKPAGYPSFMANVAWQKKDLNTFLASWTELKRDTILYAKQAYAEMGGGAPEKKDDRGYVEPNPYVYARLSALIKMTKEGLQLRNLLSQTQIDLLDRLNTSALRLKEISEKELNNQALSDDDYEFIRGYGGSLEHIWLEANKDIGIESKSQVYQEPAAIVTDVASDPNGQVLEEGTGRIFDIYVVVPIDGKLRIAKGGVFSHYEFTWPITDRLTDEAWRAMLNDNKQPEMADWTGEYIAK